MFNMKNIFIKFKFQLSRAKVNVNVAILRNMLLAVGSFHLWPDFDTTSYKFRYVCILDKFMFQHNVTKVKVTVAVRRNFFHCSGLLIFRLNLIQLHTNA